MRYVLGFLILVLFFCIVSCDSLFYYPKKEFSSKPIPPRQKELFVASSSGNRLHTFVFQPDNPKAVVLFFHGNSRNISYLYRTFFFLYESGYTYIVFDYSGYGKSEGAASRSSLYKDGIAMLNYAHQLAIESDLPLITLGQSLGGAVLSSSLDGFDSIDAISLIHLDCTFPSYRDVADYHGQFYVKIPIGSIVISDLYEPFRTYPKLRENSVLVSHCRQDTTVPYFLGQQIFSQIPTKEKEFWTFDCKHSAAFWKEENQQKLLDYYQEVLANSASGKNKIPGNLDL
ncbi:MAG: alpha/beta hydrolase [Spirochaetes bacterium]|jgi:fermentation-respiration switch protein FrsA (DUF1100 family)|nr:alpha/beta hydrolase [Spirochaetota bacterium]